MTLSSPRVENSVSTITKEIAKEESHPVTARKTFEKENKSLIKWDKKFTTLKFNMTQAGLIDYFIFCSLNLSRCHLFMLPGVNTKPKFVEVFFFLVTIAVNVQVALHIMVHFQHLLKNKKRLTPEQIEELPIVEGMIIDMHISPLKPDLKKFNFFIRN
jgi:hypothetical protein